MKTIQEAIKQFSTLDISDCLNIYDKFEECLISVDSSMYEIEEAGSFDSPGYDMSAYAVAYIEDNKPKLFTFIEENY